MDLSYVHIKVNLANLAKDIISFVISTLKIFQIVQKKTINFLNSLGIIIGAVVEKSDKTFEPKEPWKLLLEKYANYLDIFLCFP